MQRSGSVNSSHSDRLAEQAVDSYCAFAETLAGLGPYPQAQFYVFAEADRRYPASIEGSPLVHRNIVRVVNGLREYLAVERKRVQAGPCTRPIAWRQMFFSGYDPHFEGDEPPGPWRSDMRPRPPE